MSFKTLIVKFTLLASIILFIWSICIIYLIILNIVDQSIEVRKFNNKKQKIKKFNNKSEKSQVKKQTYEYNIKKLGSDLSQINNTFNYDSLLKTSNYQDCCYKMNKNKNIDVEINLLSSLENSLTVPKKFSGQNQIISKDLKNDDEYISYSNQKDTILNKSSEKINNDLIDLIVNEILTCNYEINNIGRFCNDDEIEKYDNETNDLKNIKLSLKPNDDQIIDSENCLIPNVVLKNSEEDLTDLNKNKSNVECESSTITANKILYRTHKALFNKFNLKGEIINKSNKSSQNESILEKNQNLKCVEEDIIWFCKPDLNKDVKLPNSNLQNEEDVTSDFELI